MKAPHDPGRKYRVLVVEDNAVNQKLAVKLLQKRGHEVVAVPDGHVAVEECRRARFDVVLMDIQMPVMDGLEATRAIRSWEESAGGHATIIAMTAYAMKGDRERCLEAGMDGYVSKPIDSKELFRLIDELCG